MVAYRGAGENTNIHKIVQEQERLKNGTPPLQIWNAACIQLEVVGRLTMQPSTHSWSRWSLHDGCVQGWMGGGSRVCGGCVR